MPASSKKKKTTKKKVSADEIAERAMRGENVEYFFSGNGQMKIPDKDVQRVNVDFNVNMLAELNLIASELNVTRQALIKLFVKSGMDQHFTGTLDFLYNYIIIIKAL